MNHFNVFTPFAGRFSLMVLTLLCSLLARPLNAQLIWSTETAVASGGPHSDKSMPSLALSVNGDPRIAYFTAGGDVNFVERNSGVWTDEFVASRGAANILGISLKLTSTSDPRIGFFSFANGASADDARFAARTSGSWSVEDIETTGFTGEYLHLALAGDDTPRAAFINSTLSALDFSSKATGSWVTESVTGRGAPAFLRLNSADQPFIAFKDDADSQLKVASNTSGSWTIDTAVPTFDASGFRSISMRLDGNDPLISWVDSTGVHLATKSGGIWTVENAVVDATLNKDVSSLAVDANGNAYIAYQTSANVVNVAYQSGGSWFTSTVDNGTLGSGLGESLQIEGGILGLAYNSSAGDLNFAFSAFAAVPEPEDYAAVIAGLLLAFALRRKLAHG
jgi:hypothetical protein